MKTFKLKCYLKTIKRTNNSHKFKRNIVASFSFKKNVNFTNLNLKTVRFIVKNTIKVFRYKPWYLSAGIQIGDMVHVCTGYNVKVAEFDIDYDARRKIIHNIYIIDNDGVDHPLSGCCSPKKTQKQIEDDVINYYNYYSTSDWKDGPMVANLKALKDKLDNGIAICDEDGMKV